MPRPDAKYLKSHLRIANGDLDIPAFPRQQTASGVAEESVRATIEQSEHRLQCRFDLVDRRLERLMREIDSFQAAALRPGDSALAISERRTDFSSERSTMETKLIDISPCLTMSSAESGRFKKAALKHVFRPSMEGKYWSGGTNSKPTMPPMALQGQPLYENQVVTAGVGRNGESKRESKLGSTWDFSSSAAGTNRTEMEESLSWRARSLRVMESMLRGPSKVSRSLTRSSIRGPPDFWEYLIEHPCFDPVCAVIVILNSLLVGVQINHDALHDNEEPTYRVIEYFCAGFFTIELCIRVLARKWFFCSKGEAHWASFDVILVLLSWLDVTLELASPNGGGGMPGPGASLGKVIRLARMARILRIIRMVRWLTRIRIMATLIIGSMVSLFWLLILLLTVMYIFAIVLTQGATMWLKPGDGVMPPVADPNYDDVKHYYGSVPKTIYTLFMSMTGGVNWGIPGEFSKSYGVVYFIVFICYIFFAIFSVMNIVTGVFVDGAIQQADLDRSVMMKKQRDQRLELSKQLEEVLAKLDNDEDGYLSRGEWDGIFTDAAIRAVFSSIQIDINEAEDLYDLLDVDGDGQVSIKEFIDGMFRLKGWAKAIDVERLNARAAHLLRMNKKMYKMLDICYHATRASKRLSRNSSVLRHC